MQLTNSRVWQKKIILSIKFEENGAVGERVFVHCSKILSIKEHIKTMATPWMNDNSEMNSEYLTITKFWKSYHIAVNKEK